MTEVMYVIGIDPGLGGAVAVLPDLQIYDTPVVHPSKGGRMYLPAQMADLLMPWAGGKTMAFLEKQQAMPQQGRSSVFSIMGTISQDKKKEVSRARASELYPAMSHMFQRVMDHDRAEALLLARYGLGVVK